MAEYRFTDQCFENATENGTLKRLWASELYTQEAGAGFLPEREDCAGEDFYTGTAGWIPGGKGREEERVTRRDCPEGVEISSESYPLRFGVHTEHVGRYKVAVEICGGKDGLSGLTLSAGRRNIVDRDISIPANTAYSKTFYYAVYPYRPVVRKDEPVTDFMIGISIMGKGARLSRVCVESCDGTGEQVPALFIGGDSTVRDYEGRYPYNPLTNGGSWGHNLLQYLDGMAVCNQAHSGLTTNCFRQDGHWELVKANIRPGDVFLFGFGHNDQKRRNLKPYDQFASNVRCYVMETRRLGAVPVLVTPMSRIPVRDEKGWYDLLEAHADSIRRVGQEMNVPVIDLHSLTFDVFCSMGPKMCQNYFNDTTHVNDYGGALLADMMVKEIQRLRIEPLCSHMNHTVFCGWEPDLSLRPQGQAESSKIEERPNLSMDLPELPYEDCRSLPKKDVEMLKQAMKYGLLDPCVRYLHPLEEMPRAQFVFLFLKAVKPMLRRPWQGEYCDLSRYEYDAEQIQAAWDENLIDPETTPDDRFRPDDPLTLGELISFTVRALRPKQQRSIGSLECIREARKLGWIKDTCQDMNRIVTRAEAIQMTVNLYCEKFT